jgi:predicted ATPase
MEKQKIVITGGPGSGKTTLIEALSKKNFYCFPEISREITLKSQKEGIEQLFVEDPISFSEKILEGRVKQFELAEETPADVIFFDRGIPDTVAYLNFSKQSYSNDFEIISNNKRYSKVFLLPPWEAIYERDAVRYESFNESEEIYHHIKIIYGKYGYDLIEVPRLSIDHRIDFILNYL